QRSLQIRDVRLHRLRADVFDGPGARRRPEGEAGEDALDQLGELEQVGRRRHLALAVEAGQALTDVRGVADLRRLPVVDDVDTRLHLRTDDLGDRVAYGPGQRLCVRAADLARVGEQDQA